MAVSETIHDLATARMQAAIRGALEKWFASGHQDEAIEFSWEKDGIFGVQISSPAHAGFRRLQAPKLGRSPKSTGAGAVAEILQEIRK